MVLSTTPAFLNLLIVNATPDGFSSIHQSCLADQYYGTYGDQSLFMLGPNIHCDPSELKLEPGWESNPISVNPRHELLFLKKMNIEDAITNGDTLLGGLERLAAYVVDDVPAAHDMQWQLTTDAPTYSVPYYAGDSAILSVSPQLLPYVGDVLPASYKPYALPKIPLPFRRVSEEAKQRIRHWADSVWYDGEISWIVEGLSISQLRDDVRYLTGEDPDSPILSRSSFSQDGRLAAEWIAEQIEETGAECELRQFMPGFSPNVIWCVASSPYCVDSQVQCPSVSEYESLDESAGTIIVSAHYDSRGSLGDSRAPGANDNGEYLRMDEGEASLRSCRIRYSGNSLDRARNREEWHHLQVECAIGGICESPRLDPTKIAVLCSK